MSSPQDRLKILVGIHVEVILVYLKSIVYIFKLKYYLVY